MEIVEKAIYLTLKDLTTAGIRKQTILRGASRYKNNRSDKWCYIINTETGDRLYELAALPEHQQQIVYNYYGSAGHIADRINRARVRRLARGLTAAAAEVMKSGYGPYLKFYAAYADPKQTQLAQAAALLDFAAHSRYGEFGFGSVNDYMAGWVAVLQDLQPRYFYLTHAGTIRRKIRRLTEQGLTADEVIRPPREGNSNSRVMTPTHEAIVQRLYALPDRLSFSLIHGFANRLLDAKALRGISYETVKAYLNRTCCRYYDGYRSGKSTLTFDHPLFTTADTMTGRSSARTGLTVIGTKRTTCYLYLPAGRDYILKYDADDPSLVCLFRPADRVYIGMKLLRPVANLAAKTSGVPNFSTPTQTLPIRLTAA